MFNGHHRLGAVGAAKRRMSEWLETDGPDRWGGGEEEGRRRSAAALGVQLAHKLRGV